MPIRQERTRKMADSQTSTKKSKMNYTLSRLGVFIILLLALGMVAWTIKIFFF